MVTRAFRDAGDGYYQVEINDGEPVPAWLSDKTEVPIIEQVAIVSSDAVNAERDRRIAAGFTFANKHFAFDAASKARISGGATLAGFAIGKGAPEGFLFWHGGLTPFAWIADDNSLVEMDAQTCFMFGQVAANHETAHIFAARALKDMDPVPLDYVDDQYWP